MRLDGQVARPYGLCPGRGLGIKESTGRGVIEGDLVGQAGHKTGNTIGIEGDDEQMKKFEERTFSMHLPWEDVVFNVGAKNPPRDCQWIANRIVRPLEDIREKSE